MADEYRDTLDELRYEVEKLAKRANQRLRELETQHVTESSRAYQVTARKAYDHLPGYTQTKAGNIAFDRSLKNKTIEELEEELRELDKFLEAETSTIRGYKKVVFSKAYETYKQTQHDEKITFEQYQQMFASEKNRSFGYQNVRAMQKVPGATSEAVQKEINKQIKEQRKTKQTLGTFNYAKKMSERVKQEKADKKAKRDAARKGVRGRSTAKKGTKRKR